MNKQKLFKKLKHSNIVHPSLPNSLIMMECLKFSINRITDDTKKRNAHLNIQSLYRLNNKLKEVRDKLMPQHKGRVPVKLRTNEITLILESMYIFRNHLNIKFGHNKEEIKLNKDINQVIKVYIDVSKHKDIAEMNVQKLRHVYEQPKRAVIHKK